MSPSPGIEGPDKAPKRMSLAKRRRLGLDQLDERDQVTPERSRDQDDVPSAETGSPSRPRPSTADDAPQGGASGDAGGAEDEAPVTAGASPGRRKTTAQIAREKDKVALGLYFPNAEDLDEARRAFVTDFWEHDGPDTFSEWISQAILTHAALTHTQRAELAQPRRTRRTGVKGKLRKLDVRREISDAVHNGLAEDRQQLRRQITISTWCHDAVMAAIDATRGRTAGELMEIDGPLPPRLRK